MNKVSKIKNLINNVKNTDFHVRFDFLLFPLIKKKIEFLKMNAQ
jgi:hypothetical protein